MCTVQTIWWNCEADNILIDDWRVKRAAFRLAFHACPKPKYKNRVMILNVPRS